jgi:hypothetical protein
METRKYLFETLWKRYLNEAPQFDERIIQLNQVKVAVLSSTGQQLVASIKVTGEMRGNVPVVNVIVKSGTFDHDEQLKLALIKKVVPGEEFKTHGANWDIQRADSNSTTFNIKQVNRADPKFEFITFTANEFIKDDEASNQQAAYYRQDNYPAESVYVNIEHSNVSLQDTNDEGAFSIYLDLSNTTIRPQEAN